MANTATNQEREMRVAVERVVGFAQEFGETHLNLACHAAFPLSLTPDLLYQIWANFVPEAPWTAVARVLLSRLCKQVGSEMYEMDNSVRNLLLRELKVQFGQERFDSLGEFLLEYVRQRLTEDDPDTQDLLQAQQWTALAYTKPEQAARELAKVLSDKVQQEDLGEVLRLSSLVETLSEPFVDAGFQPLLVYGRGIVSYFLGDLEQAENQFKNLKLKEDRITFTSLNLDIPIKLPNKNLLYKLDLRKFFRATNPARTLFASNSEEDEKYYIDFSSVRGDQVIEMLKKNITFFSPDKPTCQLFTGQVGCGKSTELRRLKAELEKEGFHVVYFESDVSLDMGDVDTSDILLSITRQVSQSLEDIGINLTPEYFEQRLRELINILQTPMEISELKFSVGIAEITSQAKNSPYLRNKLRGYLEPQTASIIEAINQQILEPAIKQLKSQGKKGLVVIADNLDRIASNPKPWNRNQQEYIFVDRGQQLRSINCHLVYTMPSALRFSNEFGLLCQRFENPRVLPMIPVQWRDGREHEQGMLLLSNSHFKKVTSDTDKNKVMTGI